MTKGKPYSREYKESGNTESYNGFDRVGMKVKNDGFRYPRSVIKIKNSNKNSLHPTQKPVELFEYLIKTYTKEGETVLDNCIGSGTTAVAAINLGRNFIGIEMDEEYCKIAKKRIKEIN